MSSDLQSAFRPAAVVPCYNHPKTVGKVATALRRLGLPVLLVNDGSNVTAMTLEHYPGMTQKSLAKIVETARGRWPLGDVTVIHRVGRMVVGEEIVLVAVASRHRHAAFEAASFIMDWLKTEAPFWKKEETPEGARWVDARESDDLAKARWG